MSYFGSTEYLLEVRKGNVAGHSIVAVTGRNPDVDTSPFRDITDVVDGSGQYTGFPTGAAETMEIVSTSVNDTFGGTGAQVIVIQGLLDQDFAESPNVVIQLNGTTPVSLGIITYARMRISRVVLFGSLGTNEGTITIRHTTTTTNIFTEMLPSYGTSFNAAYTVPAGKVAILLNYWSSLSDKQNVFARIRAKSRLFGSGGFVVEEEVEVASSGNSYITREFIGGSIPLPGKTDLKLEAEASFINSAVSGGGTLLVIDASLVS